MSSRPRSYPTRGLPTVSEIAAFGERVRGAAEMHCWSEQTRARLRLIATSCEEMVRLEGEDRARKKSSQKER